MQINIIARDDQLQQDDRFKEGKNIQSNNRLIVRVELFSNTCLMTCSYNTGASLKFSYRSRKACNRWIKVRRMRRELRHPFEGCVATTQQNNIISNFDTAFPYIKYTRCYDLVSLQDHNILEKRKTENERGRSGSKTTQHSPSIKIERQGQRVWLRNPSSHLKLYRTIHHKSYHIVPYAGCTQDVSLRAWMS